jgi:hypothetical protein
MQTVQTGGWRCAFPFLRDKQDSEAKTTTRINWFGLATEKEKKTALSRAVYRGVWNLAEGQTEVIGILSWVQIGEVVSHGLA